MSEQPGQDPEERLAALGRVFAEALRAAEDVDDAFDADRAWEEPGEPIPLGEVEAEFGVV